MTPGGFFVNCHSSSDNGPKIRNCLVCKPEIIVSPYLHYYKFTSVS